LILCAQRRGEVAAMRWSEVDMEARLWTIPAEKSKSGNIQLVPLSPAKFDILNNLPRFTGGDFIWTTQSGKSCINGFSKIKKRVDRATNIVGWTFHDLRRTASTIMAEPGKVAPDGVLPHILSAVLGHTVPMSLPSRPTAAVTRVYNKY